MHLMLEQKFSSPEPLFFNTDTMEISPPRVSRSQEGASPEDVYQYEFPDDACINLGGRLTSFDGAQVALFGMTYHMDESFRHHPLCSCHEDGSGNDTPRHDMGKP
jgi:hypothetical protein